MKMDQSMLTYLHHDQYPEGSLVLQVPQRILSTLVGAEGGAAPEEEAALSAGSCKSITAEITFLDHPPMGRHMAYGLLTAILGLGPTGVALQSSSMAVGPETSPSH